MMKPDIDQPPPDQNEPRYIARRVVFKALCAHYPDRHVALIEQPPLLSTELATAKDSQKPTI
jgi:hypothetical protein